MHLSLLEHGVYNQLLDWYYLDEQPLSLDNRTLFRRLSAKTETEQEAVINVLEEMFDKTDEGWIHKRVEREISEFRAKAQQARDAGKLGGRPPKKGIGSKNNRDGLSNNRDGFQNKADAKPTVNQEPLIKKETKQRKGTDVYAVVPSSSFLKIESGIGDPHTDQARAIAAALQRRGYEHKFNAHDTRLLALVQRGATVNHFMQALEINSGKNFAYLMGIVKNQMDDNGKNVSEKSVGFGDVGKINTPNTEETAQFLSRKAQEAANFKIPSEDTLKGLKALKTAILSDGKNQVVAS